ncbi:6-phosphofructokinase [Candidatus Epulonipiscium fishelsonii]|uniref:6-phosphofructokinase n=1 Tax=Candidatus Epulonipiscium fishelsonii TaxID=77094 RepID=A0ACC8XA34_9FIRM|nr:6-phosphofructokinase [Epulopiscium sp. SCG-B11WGA-EpuloA1]ONI43762.1 6-phosphofructokinase [Epulopiscium sp. SCG-B05WGA-EpuloA1]
MEINKIGVLTSGGDSPGMNATIRAVVRTAKAKGIDVLGIRDGYKGLLAGDMINMTAKTVSDIIQRGGTILQTARCREFMQAEYQERGAHMCKVFGLDGLIVIGGDGSFQGAEKLANLGINTVGIPGTIDLDIACTDYTIGFDTAVNTAMDSINKIRDTSSSHSRCSIVEVMGRNAGHIALWCGITTGAELVLVPELPRPANEDIIKKILETKNRGKKHFLIVVAEGVGGCNELAAHIEEVTGIETRATILGYLQRGGAPTALDRLRASMMGAKAVDLLCEGKTKRVVAYVKGEYTDFDINEALTMRKPFDKYLYDLCDTLSQRY